MNTDFRLCTGLFTHPKFLKLERRLGPEGALSLIRLFCFAAQNRPNGSLRGMDAESIAMAADYKGDAEEFVSALVSLRWLDGTLEQYAIHDWEEHNPWVAGAPERSDKARRAADARWGRKGNAASPIATPYEQKADNTNDDTLRPGGGCDDAHLCYEHATSMRLASFSNAPLLSSPIQGQGQANARETQAKTEAMPESAEPAEPTRLTPVQARQKFIRETLQRYPHWEEPLADKVVRFRPSNSLAYQASVLQGWLEGDGTPLDPRVDAYEAETFKGLPKDAEGRPVNFTKIGSKILTQRPVAGYHCEDGNFYPKGWKAGDPMSSTRTAAAAEGGKAETSPLTETPEPPPPLARRPPSLLDTVARRPSLTGHNGHPAASGTSGVLQ